MKPNYFIAALCFLLSTSAFSAQVTSDTEATRLAIDAMHEYKLTTLNDDCVLVAAAEKPAYFEITMRELHSKSCGGDPETGPRLFNIRVRKRDGRLTSDAYDGTTYQRVNRKPKPSR